MIFFKTQFAFFNFSFFPLTHSEQRTVAVVFSPPLDIFSVRLISSHPQISAPPWSNYEALTSIIYHSIICQKWTIFVSLRSSTIYVCFSRYLRFNHLLHLGTPIVKKEDNIFQKVISAEKFLDVKLKVLVSVEFQLSARFSYRIEKC